MDHYASWAARPCFLVGLVLLFSSSILEAALQLDSDEQRPKLSAVGVVYCDECNHGLHHNARVQPLADVEVKVTCHDLYGLVTLNAVGFTNQHGAFSIPMDDLPPVLGIAGCKARLVRSLQEHCDVVSDVGGGHSGAPLRLMSRALKHVILTAGPFAYHPSTSPTTCHQSSYPLPPPLHIRGNTNYASPVPPPTPPVHHHGIPPPHSSSPPRSTSPPPPSPSPLYLYKSPPPPPHRSPAPPSYPPLPPQYPPYFSVHHFHHHHRQYNHRPPPPPPYYYAHSFPPPSHSSSPPPYRY
ncbi:hypothetical protein L7F22_023839 [Adiantum nelumboides]|nr:hypothetical protein [Adiantum nelumboides]